METRMLEINKQKLQILSNEWQWIEHVARADENKVAILPRETVKSVGRPQKLWLDDIK